jgi:hypothetical protein
MRSLNTIPGVRPDLKGPVADLLSAVLLYVRDGPGEGPEGTYQAFKNILSVHS